MPSINVLHTGPDQALGDKIAKALCAEGHDACCVIDTTQADAFDPCIAAVVIWSPAAVSAVMLAARAQETLVHGALVPVSIAGAHPPAALAHLQPIDLTGWNGDDKDPRWRFVIDEIALAAQRDLLKNGDIWPDGGEPRARKQRPDDVPIVGAPVVDVPIVSTPIVGAPVAAPPIAAAPIAASVAIAYALRDSLRQTPDDDADMPAADKPLAALRDVIQGELFMGEAAPLPGFPAASPPLPPQGFKPAHVALGGVVGLMALVAGVFFAAPFFLQGAPAPPMTLAAQGPAPDIVRDSGPEDIEEDNIESGLLEPGPLEPGPLEPGLLAFVDLHDPDGPPDWRSEALYDDAPAPEGEGDISGPVSGPTSETEPEDAASEAQGVEALILASVAPAPDPDQPFAAHDHDTHQAAKLEQAETAYLGNYFRECVQCPDMAALPAGEFVMGAPLSEKARHVSEGPVTQITIAQGFAMGTREVTFAQWDACVADGGCRAYSPADGGWGRKNHPVINVSFEDAQAYVAWLATATGQPYRLPSEAEWEYAARAGSAGAFSFGEAIDATRANFNGEYVYNGPKTRNRGRTMPAASFAPNAFGLFDMHGNVWEWTADCWSENHAVLSAAPPVNRAPEGGACAARVLKGGAWNTGGWRLRSAHRIAKAGPARENDNGFRVARDLN